MATPHYYKKTFFPQRRAEISSDETLQQCLQWADDHYSDDDTDTRFRVAYTYFAAAQYLQEAGRFKPASDYYHFAGHHLRSVDNLNNAALAYVAGGEAAEKAATEDAAKKVEYLEWAVRSYARATVCFSEVGEAERASQAYVAQQDARRRLAWAQGKVTVGGFLELLRVTSRYGQSGGRLGATVVIMVIVYGLAYGALTRDMTVAMRDGWHWWSGYYYALVIALSFDPKAIETSSPPLQWLALSNVVVAWILLGVGAALVARRVRER